MKLNKSKLAKAIPFSMLLAAALVLLPAASASTAIPMKGSGTFNATVYTDTTLYSFGGYTIYSFTGQDVFSGTEVGTGSFVLTLLVFPSGGDVGAGTVTCPSCTVDGVAGTFSLHFTSEGTFGGSGVGQGELSGSGGLTGFHGLATFQDVTTETGFTGPYQVTYVLG